MIEKRTSSGFHIPGNQRARRNPADLQIKVEELTHDLRDIAWCSIDNDDSLDLDQLTVAMPMSGEAVKILVAIADVDAVVKKQSALDDHAKHNTTSVYTAQRYSQCCRRNSQQISHLSTLNQTALPSLSKSLSAAYGSLQSSDVYQAIVRNRAKLAYNSLAAWLDESGPMPQAIGTVNGLVENLRLQDGVARKLKSLRHAHGP